MRRTLQAGAWNIAAGLGTAGAGLLYTSLTARVVSLGALGDLGVIITVSGVIAVLESARVQDLTAVYTSSAGSPPVPTRRTFGYASAVLLIAILLLYVAAGRPAAITAALVWSGAVLQVVTAPLTAAAQAGNRYDRIAMTSLVGLSIGVAVALGLARRLGLPGIGLGLLASSAFSRGSLWVVGRDDWLRFRRRADAEQGPPELAQLGALVALNGVAQVVNLTDITTVRGIAGTQEAGRYRAGTQLPTALILLIYRGFDVLLPRLAAGTTAEAARLLRRAAPAFSMLIGATLGGVVALRNPDVRLKADTALLRLPLVGRLIRDLHGAKMARTLSTMIAAGLPVLEGLTITARTVSNRRLRLATETMADAVREGGGLSAAMRRADVFPPILVYMTASGESSGRLEPMLERAADYLEREFSTFTAVMLSLLEPAIIVVMGGVVALIVLSILLPILQINTLAMG